MFKYSILHRPWVAVASGITWAQSNPTQHITGHSRDNLPTALKLSTNHFADKDNMEQYTQSKTSTAIVCYRHMLTHRKKINVLTQQISCVVCNCMQKKPWHISISLFIWTWLLKKFFVFLNYPYIDYRYKHRAHQDACNCIILTLF